MQRDNNIIISRAYVLSYPVMFSIFIASYQMLDILPTFNAFLVMRVM